MEAFLKYSYLDVFLIIVMTFLIFTMDKNFLQIVMEEISFNLYKIVTSVYKYLKYTLNLS
jgi:hypothetical protein